MAKKTINKEAQNNFLMLGLSEQIELLNNKIIEKGELKAISELGFSDTWAKNKMKERGVYYVSSIKKFVVQDNVDGLSEGEIVQLRTIIEDYNEFKNKKEDKNVKLCAGSCTEDSVTRSIVVDKEVNNRWNEFTKKHSYINSKDLWTSALMLFLDEYDR